MAVCSKCGKTINLLAMVGGQCEDCYFDRKPKAEASTAKHAERSAMQSKAAGILLTTETAAADLIIAERLGIVTAECVFGMHMFRDIFAIGRDIFGGRSDAIQNTLKDARKTALDELRIEAAHLGADAVIAVDLDYSEISGGGKSMLFLVATGTAVRLG